MARVQSWMIGLTVLLWASACAASEQYVEPAPGGAGPDEAVHAAADPKPDGEYVTEPSPDGDCTITGSVPQDGSEVPYANPDEGHVGDPHVDGEYTVTADVPEDGYDVIYAEADGGYVGDPGPGDDSTVTGYSPQDGYGVVYAEAGEGHVGDSGINGDYTTTSSGPGSQDVVDPQNGGGEIAVLIATEGSDAPEAETPDVPKVLTMAPDGTFEVTGPGVDVGCEAATLIASADRHFTPAESQQAFVGTVDLSEQIGQLAGMQGNMAGVNWSSMPTMAQIRSDVGLGLMAHVAACGNVTYELPDLATPYNTMASQVSARAVQTFAGIEVPETAGFLANR